MVAPGIGLLRVTYFPGELGIGFANALDPVMKSLKESGANRLIIDLRGNIGGGLGLARLASYLCPGQIPIGYSLTPGRLRKGYKKEDLPSVPMPQTRMGLLWTLGASHSATSPSSYSLRVWAPSRFTTGSSCS